MPIRTARTDWTGDLTNGSGTVELVSSGAGSYDLSFLNRAADQEADGTTTPEELLAAAQSASYAMELSSLLAKAGGEPKRLQVTSEVSLGPDPDRGSRLMGIAMTVRAEVDDLDSAGFAKVAEEAEKTCPVSKVLGHIGISLDAALE